MRIAIVGCGYVADFYMRTLVNHPELELAGVMDRDGDRAARFAAYHSAHLYGSLEELLADPQVELVVNLTNPRSHYAVSRACLEAGKHVYSEKPLAAALGQAEELVRLAGGRGLHLASAPCSVLGETAQTLWKAVRTGAIGKVRLVYAELDDGLIHRTGYRDWRSQSGNPWPYKDEFETGCTLEHAGYYVTWLAAIFGPVQTLTSYASCLIPDKETDVPLDALAPDFSVACLEFASGVAARLTCSIVAPHDRGLRIIGDDGVLSIHDCWDYGATVRLHRRTPLALRLEKYPLLAGALRVGQTRYPLVRRPRFQYRAKGANRMDFCRGVAELAAAIGEGRRCRLSAQYSLHVNEIVLAIQDPQGMGTPYRLKSTFEPPEPMPWAV